MAFYLYECVLCGKKIEDFRAPSKRDLVLICETCEGTMVRIFHPGASASIWWMDKGDTRPSTSGPTRKNHYTVGDVANENGWHKKWGIKK